MGSIYGALYKISPLQLGNASPSSLTFRYETPKWGALFVWLIGKSNALKIEIDWYRSLKPPLGKTPSGKIGREKTVPDRRYGACIAFTKEAGDILRIVGIPG
jgi:hypothetical protein